MFTHTLCVLLAPTLARAAAFQWSLPEPTTVVPAPDNWSPAPTTAPGLELFRRQIQVGSASNTCGFISGLSASSITCSNSNLVCATNTLHGVHGCCDSNSIDSCIIPTTCIASTAISTICTDAICSSDSAILKCTEPAATECYRYIIHYSKTSMTQHGCTNKGFTALASRTWGERAELYRTTTVFLTQSASAAPTLTPSTDPTKPSLGAIIGGTVGGCTVLTIFAIVAFILRTRRKKQRNNNHNKQRPIPQFHNPDVGVTEYNPYGFPTPSLPQDEAKWQQHQGPVTRPSDAMPQYPGMNSVHYGIVEVDGLQRAVEAPTENVYHARGCTQFP